MLYEQDITPSFATAPEYDERSELPRLSYHENPLAIVSLIASVTAQIHEPKDLDRYSMLLLRTTEHMARILRQFNSIEISQLERAGRETIAVANDTEIDQMICDSIIAIYSALRRNPMRFYLMSDITWEELAHRHNNSLISTSLWWPTDE